MTIDAELSPDLPGAPARLPSRRRPRVVFVDREGASSIWGLMQAIAGRLEDRGWQGALVVMTDESGIVLQPRETILGFTRIAVPAKRWKGDLIRQQRAFERAFSKLLREVRPDVVHVNFAIPGIWARRVARRRGVPCVISTQHELAGSLSPHLRLGLWATRGCVDVHTYVSDTVAASFGYSDLPAGVEGETLPSHVVIRNGVDASTIRSFRGPPDAAVPGRIVAPGRLVPEKGQASLIHALADVRETHPQAHLVFAGSGPEEGRLHRLADKLGLADAVTFKGWLPREALWRLLASGRAAAFASNQEGFGLALAEAAFLETPLVASRIAAFREVMADDDEAAWWFQPGDPESLASALRGALSADTDERERRTGRAYRAARERATEDLMIEQYARLYERIAAARRLAG